MKKMHLQVFLLLAFVPCLRCIQANTIISPGLPTQSSGLSTQSSGFSTQPPRPFTRPPRPRPSSTFGWSDDNYEMDDSRSSNRYNGGRYGGDRYNNRDDGYDDGDRYGDDEKNDRYNNNKNDGYGDKKDQYNKNDGYGDKKDQYNKNDGYGDKKDQYNKNDGYGDKKDQYNKKDNNYPDKKNQYNDKDGYDDDDEQNYDADKDRSSRRKRVPDEYGNMNIYIREEPKYGKEKKYKKMRFPVHRFKPGRFPPLPPLISFFPWLPIFADKLTKQTIIFSPTGGLYIIPPVINFYGRLFSVAELISTGYASLVRTGIPPPAGINVAPLIRPGAVVGPGIPLPNLMTGGFIGGMAAGIGGMGGIAG